MSDQKLNVSRSEAEGKQAEIWASGRDLSEAEGKFAAADSKI